MGSVKQRGYYTTRHVLHQPFNLLPIAKILYNIEIYKGLSNKIKIKDKV